MKAMFVNRYERSLDSKHRLVLPAKFRSLLGERVYLGLQGNSLAVYSEEAFWETSQRLLEKVRTGEIEPQARLAFGSNTVDIDIDSAGRITIPQWMRESVNLTSDVVVAGAVSHIEIWNKDSYEGAKPALSSVVQEQFEAGGTIN